MKFLCDDNLGKLAKYLRMLGFDTFFRVDIEDAELLGVMLKEDRLVLTRDHRLAGRIEPGRHLLIATDLPEEQLKFVIDKLNLEIDKDNLFSICLECNAVCQAVDADEIKDKIFPYIIKTQDSFKRCPSCGRIYWQGSHYKDMVQKLKGIVKGL